MVFMGLSRPGNNLTFLYTIISNVGVLSSALSYRMLRLRAAKNRAADAKTPAGATKAPILTTSKA